MSEPINIIDINENESVAQFNFENNTSSPIAINLFDTASLQTIPTSGSTQTSYTSSGDLLPSLPPSLLEFNPTNNVILSADPLTDSYRVINTLTNTTNNSFDNSIGFNAQVNAIVIQTDGKILVGGAFVGYKGLTENRIIRLNSDGTKDLTFDNSIGFNAQVNAIVIQTDGKILVGGAFTTYKGLTENRIIRLNSDGTKDLTFDNSIGFNNQVFSIAIQTDGKILLGGAFITYKGLAEVRIIRLNSNGTKDLTFDNSIGFDNVTRKLAIQTDGKILVGGQFTLYKGLTENRIIRLNSDGTKDLTFDNSIGFNSFVNRNAIAIQNDGKILVGGAFVGYKGLTENRIIRLNSDGTKDLTFDNSIGFDDEVNLISIQNDGKILVGGAFTTYKGVSENRIIRLNSNGTKDLSFDNSIGFNNDLIDLAIQTDGKILVGGSFTTYKGYTNNFIINLDTNGNTNSVLQVGNNSSDLAYCSINNTFYTCPIAGINNDIREISGDGQIKLTNIILPSPTQVCEQVEYNVSNNSMYYLVANTFPTPHDILVLDCSTNTFTATINMPSALISGLSNVTATNDMYFFDGTSGLLQKINCTSNTIVLVNITLPNISVSVSSIQYNASTNLIYVMSSATNIVDVVDASTDTYLTSITIPAIYNFSPFLSSINTTTNQLFISDSNALNQKQFAVIDCQSNTFNAVQSLGIGVGATYGVMYNSYNQQMYVSGSLFSIVTFIATPFFIGGTNYNYFVNSLTNEPISVDKIRIITISQIQLYNQVQFTKIDSNGNQIFFPEFPITKVDSYQEQGNISILKLNGLIFDGRTYINGYVINPNQVVSFEVYYRQLDRDNIKSLFEKLTFKKQLLKGLFDDAVEL
jgi:uncharacterized delta-60 repeat protein